MGTSPDATTKLNCRLVRAMHSMCGLRPGDIATCTGVDRRRLLSWCWSSLDDAMLRVGDIERIMFFLRMPAGQFEDGQYFLTINNNIHDLSTVVLGSNLSERGFALAQNPEDRNGVVITSGETIVVVRRKRHNRVPFRKITIERLVFERSESNYCGS